LGQEIEIVIEKKKKKKKKKGIFCALESGGVMDLGSGSP
jgi:hypothetical protein